tara:strand:- start:98 stop:355 length:258 start_codon:yes stop_codon:yes gene_type:complete
LAASSRSIDVSNSIFISATPVCALLVICFVPSTAPITSSRGSIISEEIISGEAQSNLLLYLQLGFGYFEVILLLAVERKDIDRKR